MIQNLLNRTIINYMLVTIGSIVAAKVGIPGDLWEVARSGIEEAVVVAIGGGSVLAVIVGAARGILDSNKTKATTGGKQVEVGSLANDPNVPKQIRDDAKIIVDKTRSLADILSGK